MVECEACPSCPQQEQPLTLSLVPISALTVAGGERTVAPGVASISHGCCSREICS